MIPPQKNRLIVVLGMHRSGTSAIARGLKVLGVELGDKIMPPVEGNNAKGFYEDIDLNALNIEMLNTIESDWHHVAAFDSIDAEILRKKGHFLHAAELLRQKVSSATVFGFKDPRVAKLLPFWKGVISHCQLDVSYVLAVRNPLSVVKSLAKRDSIEAEQAYLMWLAHVLTSLTDSAGAMRVLVDYDRLMQSPDHELNRMAKHLDLEIDPTELQSYKTEFLDQKLRHTVYELNDLLLDDTCPPIVREIYAALLDVASDKAKIDDAELQKKVVRWSDEFERLKSPLLLIDRLITQKQSVAERDRQIAGLAQAVHDKEVHIGNLDHAVAERDVQIGGLKQVIAERDGQIGGLSQAVHDKDVHIGNIEHVLSEHEKQINELIRGAAEIRGSISWRLTRPIRYVGRQLLRIKIVRQALQNSLPKRRGYRGLMKHVWRTYKNEGIDGVKRRMHYSASPGAPPPVIDYAPSPAIGHAQPHHNDYGEWVRRYDTLTDQDRGKIKTRISRLQKNPLISVVMPVYNPPLTMLEDAIRSVQGQLYPNWELCIADDASTDKDVHKLLQRYAENDSRIKVVFREKNGHISAASNSALDLANGEYVALLDNDDLLPEQALFWVADTIDSHPDAGLIYSDEDKIDQSGQRYDPYFKPDWNPDLFLSHNMICHLGVYRTDLVRKLGGFREGYEGAQDYDLALRCTEQLAPQQIVHIPRVLYHWRSHPGSTAQAGSEKNYALSAGERALNDHFSRIHISAKAELLDFGMYRARYALPSSAPLVSLIIPTHNGLHLIKQCIESILAKTTYQNYEILVVDNNSDDPNTLAYFASLAENNRIRVLRDERPFNYSALNNAAVQQARGEYVGLINNDIEVIAPEWLDEMMGLAIQLGVGAVGACLWYPNDTLQHGGCITGIGGVAGHSHKYLPRGHFGYFARAQLIQTLSVVTAACLVIKKCTFQEVGGLDEKNLKVAFNDIDFCLRVREAGYRNVWTPYAELYHHESATRGYEDTPEKQSRFRDEVLFMQKSWGHLLMDDPAYSPNLTLDREDFSYAWPPRTAPLTHRKPSQTGSNQPPRKPHDLPSTDGLCAKDIS
ncbi:MAG: glycosyltransferase [Sulfuricellaceae bacterium]